jgi:hypothetical protein
MAQFTAPEPIRKRSVSLQLVTPTRGGAGGMVGTSGRFEVRSGARFSYSFEIPSMLTTDALEVRAWLHALRGASNVALLKTPPSASGGATTASAANVGDTVITVASAAAAAVGNTFVVGDTSSAANFVQICRVVAVVGSAVTFEPRLRSNIADATLITFGEAWARFRLDGDTPAVPLVPQRSEPFGLAFEELV